MARKRIEPVPALNSWDDVDLKLCEIGECQRAAESIEADMQQAIDNAKLAAEIEAAPYYKRIAVMESQIKDYVDGHIDELGGKKSKMLTFGSVGYRKSTKVILPRAPGKLKEIIMQLRARGMGDCVLTPPARIDKEALKKYPANDIVAVGANLQAEDVFWYEPDRERLVAKEAL